MEHVLESPGKRIFESWKTLEFGLCKSWKVLEKKHFNVCTNPVIMNLVEYLNANHFDLHCVSKKHP